MGFKHSVQIFAFPAQPATPTPFIYSIHLSTCITYGNSALSSSYYIFLCIFMFNHPEGAFGYLNNSKCLITTIYSVRDQLEINYKGKNISRSVVDLFQLGVFRLLLLMSNYSGELYVVVIMLLVLEQTLRCLPESKLIDPFSRLIISTMAQNLGKFKLLRVSINVCNYLIEWVNQCFMGPSLYLDAMTTKCCVWNPASHVEDNWVKLLSTLALICLHGSGAVQSN